MVPNLTLWRSNLSPRAPLLSAGLDSGGDNKKPIRVPARRCLNTDQLVAGQMEPD